MDSGDKWYEVDERRRCMFTGGHGMGSCPSLTTTDGHAEPYLMELRNILVRKFLAT